MKLAELQRQFWLLAAREGAGDPAAFIESSPGLGARERIDIYADMFIWRQVDALRDDFPRVAEKLGEKDFFETAERYLRAHPSTHASLSELGRHFADFLQGELAELARVEWACAKAFEAPDVEPLERLSGVKEEDLPLVRLRFVPALRLAGSTVVWKKEFEVQHAPVEEDELRALQLAMEGHPLGVVCEAFDAIEPAFRAISSWFAEGFVSAQEMA